MIITITRSAEWVQRQRLARGENIHTSVDVEVNPADLSEPARELLLRAGGGRYRDATTRLPYNSEYEITPSAGYGRHVFCIDSDSPSTEEVDAAIVAAGAQIATEKLKSDQQRAEKQAQDEATRLEKEAHDAKVAEARTILNEVLKNLESERDRAVADRQLLAEFIWAIPPDAKRGALRKIAAQAEDNTIEALKDKFEQAAPRSIYILNDLEEDEEDEEDDD